MNWKKRPVLGPGLMFVPMGDKVLHVKFKVIDVSHLYPTDGSEKKE